MSSQDRDALVGEIARTLRSGGEYVADLDARPLQGVVDMRWAMKTAGRKLGLRVDISERRERERVILVATLR